MNTLRLDLADAQTRLDQSMRRNVELEGQVVDLLQMNQQVQSASQVQTELLSRLDTIEQVRLREFSTELAAQANRVKNLNSDLDQLRESPPIQTIVSLEKSFADLDAQVAINQRLSNSNRESLVEVTRVLDRHEQEFDRQMKLLGEYIREQFVPLAEGFVKHLYEEAKRLSKSSQELEDFARKVDPYKFTHLLPGYTKDRQAPTHEVTDPAKSKDE